MDEDALGGAAPSTDDTPTTITRNSPPPITVVVGESGSSVRGRHLSHFELLEPIGVGGMAAVLRARDTQLDRIVALKILPPEMAVDPEHVRRFHQEARSAAKLDHENIARVFFCGEDQRLHFIAFEFVEGDNLRMLLDRRGRLPVGEAVHYILQVAAGLAHATQRGVVHRDIKPSNIIITPTGRAKLVDMGLARSMSARSDDDLTQSGVTLGTFDYISPEQALEPRDADVRSDIYSLGCTFYHTLTGQPSVPEGTAAKKLHHHQHVRPADPRDVVPDLPIEVVRILDRMMAKNPRDRFQSAEQLVHQLLLVARKLGASTDITEGVLTVEASIPNPPTSRPLLWAALAAVAVVVLVLVLDQPSVAPTNPGHRPDTPSKLVDGNPNPKTPGEFDKGSKVGPIIAPPNPDAVVVYTAPDIPTAQHLLDWLKEHATALCIELRLAGHLDVSGFAMSELRGLLLTARQEVVIVPRDKESRPTIRLVYDAGPLGTLVALTIKAQKSRIEGVRFILDARLAPNLEMQALLLGEGDHKVLGCEFIQAQAALGTGQKRVASIVADVQHGRDNKLTITDCVFLGFGELSIKDADSSSPTYTFGQGRKGGQDAVVRRGPVKVIAKNCFFGPHAGVFRLERGNDEATVSVTNCSILLPPAGRATVFDLPASGAGRIEMTNSLVSRCRQPGEGDGEATLIRQNDDSAKVVYQGEYNAYHDLDAFWVTGDWQNASWTDFRTKVEGTNNKDEHSRLLLTSPWRLGEVEHFVALDQLQLDKAAALDLEAPALRKSRRFVGEIIGSASILGKSWLPPELPTLRTGDDPSRPRTLFVEANGADALNGVYPDLDSAILAARSRDTIVIRHQGKLKIGMVRLEKKGPTELTIRRARRFRTVLELDSSSDAESAFFRVDYCKLSLEGLEFLVQPSASQTTAQGETSVGVVALVGDGECLLRDCIATFQKAETTKTALALATLVEPGKVMKPDMPTARTRDQGPRLSLERCFIRGEGHLVWTRATRPFALEVKDSLLSVAGSVVHIDATPDALAPPDTQKVLIKLTQTTTWLGSSLIRIKATKEVRGLVPVTCSATGCLFLPATKGQALIQLDAPEGEEIRDRFTWTGSQNGYGDYAGQFSPEPGDVMPAVGMEDKTSKTGVKPKDPPPASTPYAEMKPGQFNWTDMPTDMGVKVATMPQPMIPGR